jgi:hypothetical protein
LTERLVWQPTTDATALTIDLGAFVRDVTGED